MTPELDNILVSSIKEGKRAREDYGNMADLEESIRIEGIIQPITVRREGKEYVLIAGGRRLRAAKAVGLETVPALIRDFDGPVNEMEVELLENLVRKDMTWQEISLQVERIHVFHQELHGEDWGQRKTAKLLGKSVGNINRKLEMAQFLRVLPELKGVSKERDANKIIKTLEEEAIVHELSRRHKETAEEEQTEYYKNANNHYIIGDALEGLKKLAPGIIDFLEIDPPYGIDLHDQKKGKTVLDKYEEVEAEEYPEFLAFLADQSFRVAKDHGWMIFWFGTEWYPEVRSALTLAGWSVDPLPGIWFKGTGQTGQPDSVLARVYETFFICRKGSPSLHKQGKGNVFVHTPVPQSKKYHPTQKPVELMKDLLNTFAFPGSRVLSPFLGSGVTLRAAYQLDMIGFGWDKNERNKLHFIKTIEEDSLNAISPTSE